MKIGWNLMKMGQNLSKFDQDVIFIYETIQNSKNSFYTTRTKEPVSYSFQSGFLHTTKSTTANASRIQAIFSSVAAVAAAAASSTTDSIQGYINSKTSFFYTRTKDPLVFCRLQNSHNFFICFCIF